jgi:hypothetical protein
MDNLAVAKIWNAKSGLEQSLRVSTTVSVSGCTHLSRHQKAYLRIRPGVAYHGDATGVGAEQRKALFNLRQAQAVADESTQHGGVGHHRHVPATARVGTLADLLQRTPGSVLELRQGLCLLRYVLRANLHLNGPPFPDGAYESLQEAVTDGFLLETEPSKLMGW